MFDFGSRSLVAAPFRPVDVEAVARSLKLRWRGRDDGVKELPLTDAPELSPAELEVQGNINAHRLRALEALSAHLRAANDRLAQLAIQMDIAKMRQDTANAETNFEAIRHRVDTEMSTNRGAVREAQAEYDLFREENRLTRPPREQGPIAWKCAVLLGAIIAESAFNGLLFAGGSDSGILGGVGIALGLSFVNVIVIGVLGGLIMLRYARCRQIWKQVLAVLGCLIIVGFLGTLNLFIAHLRDAYAGSDTPPSPISIINDMIANPVQFSGIESMLLLVLGICCGCLGMYEFLRFNDPYPGYTAVRRRLVKALHGYADTRDDLLEQATEARDEILGRLNNAMQSLRGAAQQRSAALDTRSRFIASYEAHESDVEQAARQLLAIYRDENVAVRKSAPPLHFREVFNFRDPGLQHATIRSLMTEPPAPPDSEKLVKELEALAARALTAFGDTIAMLPAEAV